MGSGTATSASAAIGGGPAAVWGAQQRMLRVQVIGASGAVGREVVGALLRAAHPLSHLGLYARTEGSLNWRGQSLAVHPLERGLPQADLAFLCTPAELGPRLAPVLLGGGTRVVDLSGGNRWREDVPMVLGGISQQGLGPFTSHVALPGRTTSILARPLWYLDRAYGLKEVQLVVMRSAAADGAGGILALRGQEGRDVQGREGNLRPGGGRALVDGSCSAETEILWDLRHLFVRSDLPLEVSVIEADVERCDGVMAHLELERCPTPAEVYQTLKGSAGIQVHTDPRSPSALCAEGSEQVHVGRIRTGSRGPGSLCFFAVGDQLRLGAAAAALEAASRLQASG